MLKRTALVLTLAAALVAAAPTAPLAPAAADSGPGQPAWGHYLYAHSTWMSFVSTATCGLVPAALAMGGAGGIVFGLACGFTGAA